MKYNEFLVFADMRFRGKAKAELKSITRYKDTEEYNCDKFIVVETKDKVEKVLAKMGKLKPTFIDILLPVIAIQKYKKDYSNVIATLVKKIPKGKSFRIEVLEAQSGISENAKSVEVFIGKTLEASGLVVDLDAPDMFIYIIFFRDVAIICRLEKGSVARYKLDYFRYANNQKLDKISRAEFKLQEAIEYFEIDTSKMKNAIDIGASPGGWTNHLSKNGVSVTAIDSAELDKKLDKRKNITFIKKKAEDLSASAIKKLKGADMLLCDMNITPDASAKLANRFAVSVKKNGILIFTIKLVDTRIDKHINDAKKALSSKYTEFIIKKLPHNRMELTLFAKRK